MSENRGKSSGITVLHLPRNASIPALMLIGLITITLRDALLLSVPGPCPAKIQACAHSTVTHSNIWSQKEH